MNVLQRQLGVLGRRWGSGIAFLLYDKFSTDTAAPLSTPRTCEPGPGTFKVVNGTYLSIVSGVATTVGTDTNPKTLVDNAARTRAMGLAVVGTISRTGAGNGPAIGFAPNQNGVRNSTTGLFLRSTSSLMTYENNVNWEVSPVAHTGNIECCIVLRPTGSYYFAKGGGQYTDWTLLWVETTTTASTLYPYWDSSTGIATVDNFRVVSLGDYDSRFATDYALATSRLAGSVSQGTGFTHEANCLPEAVITTLPSSSDMQINFRQQSATNTLRLAITTAGALRLERVVNGTVTQYPNSSGVAGAVSNGTRIVVVADGSTVRVYTSNTLRITQTITDFQTATAGSVAALGGGAVSNIVAWPRTVTLPDGI